jgi:hypothetical protein
MICRDLVGRTGNWVCRSRCQADPTRRGRSLPAEIVCHLFQFEHRHRSLVQCRAQAHDSHHSCGSDRNEWWSRAAMVSTGSRVFARQIAWRAVGFAKLRRQSGCGTFDPGYDSVCDGIIGRKVAMRSGEGSLMFPEGLAEQGVRAGISLQRVRSMRIAQAWSRSKR